MGAHVGPGEFGAWLSRVTPGWRWDWPHLRLVQSGLQRLTNGETDRLMLFLPPRHGKSECATVRYPVFRLCLRPELRVIIGAYNQTLAEHFSRKARRLLREQVTLSRERAAVDDWETEAGGGLRAVGVGGGVTGMGANLVVIDDPVKSREEAESRSHRDRVWDWYRDDLYTRLEPGGAIVLIMTRWHEDDLAGRILGSEEGKSWDVIRLPARAESQEERDQWARQHGRNPGEPDPLGRKPGEALCPERYDERSLARIETVMGRSFSALYQQRPQPSEGGLFRREWFQVTPRAPGGIRWVRFWDCAAGVKEYHDYSAGALAGCTEDGRWYIGGMVRGRWTYPDLKGIVLQTAAADGREVRIGIEKSSNGLALIEDLQRTRSGVTFCPVPVTLDKVIRAGAWASLACGGLVHLVQGSWIGPFLDEVEVFPAGAHDDQVDAVSGAHEMLIKTASSSAEIRRLAEIFSVERPRRPDPTWG